MPKGTFGHEADSFRELLRAYRERAGLTQSEVAAELGVPQSYVSKYETGERRLDFTETAAVCGVLGVSIVEFAKTFERKTRKQS